MIILTHFKNINNREMNDTEINFENCCRFIKTKLPNTKCNFTDLNETKNVLHKLIEDRILYLTETGVYHDEWPDDMELSEIESFYGFIVNMVTIANIYKTLSFKK